MALTFRGTAKSYIQIGNDATTQNLFTIENGHASRVDLKLQRLTMHNDNTLILTAVMPISKISRATAISGGAILEKKAFDTTQTSDSNVIFRAGTQEVDRITATPGDTIWQQFVNRMHTAVEQQQDDDRNTLPKRIAETGKEFILHPSEAIVVRLFAAVGTSNAMSIPNYFVECTFSEYSLSTFSIGGTVTLSATPVEGAKVMVIEADDELLTNPFLVEVITTPAGGTWSSTIKTGRVGAAFVQYKNGTTYYTAPGSPFLS
jgi:hypothetical protein